MHTQAEKEWKMRIYYMKCQMREKYIRLTRRLSSVFPAVLVCFPIKLFFCIWGYPEIHTKYEYNDEGKVESSLCLYYLDQTFAVLEFRVYLG